jgi:hypothetical protein
VAKSVSMLAQVPPTGVHKDVFKCMTLGYRDRSANSNAAELTGRNFLCFCSARSLSFPRYQYQLLWETRE